MDVQKDFGCLLWQHPKEKSDPISLLTYSSQTFEDQPSSRNLEHFKAIQEIQQLVGLRPIVFDREFSYCQLLKVWWMPG
jgi:hypothetical protein